MEGAGEGCRLDSSGSGCDKRQALETHGNKLWPHKTGHFFSSPAISNFSRTLLTPGRAGGGVATAMAARNKKY
jgi:hypothetical protein